MDHNSSRPSILNLIRDALARDGQDAEISGYSDMEFFVREPGSDVELFERCFTRLQGKCNRCSDITTVIDAIRKCAGELLDRIWYCSVPVLLPAIRNAGVRLTEDVLQAEVAVTDCECLVARTGSVVLSAAQSAGRALPVYAPVHVVIATEEQILYDTSNAISFLLGKYGGNFPSSLHFVAGPSRTGDIEKTLVTGVHGPKDVFVMLLER